MSGIADGRPSTGWLHVALGLVALVSLVGGPDSSSALDERIPIRANGSSGSIVTVEGPLGPRCASCEVLVEYEGGLVYAHEPLEWTDGRVRIRIADLNRGTRLRLRIRTAEGVSAAIAHRLDPRLEPVEFPPGIMPPSKLDDRFFFERIHKLSVGDKGEDVFRVGTKAPGCGEAAYVYHDARIAYRENRFGEARIVFAPEPGCTRCAPLRVRWYHEPTGRLIYQLHVRRRQVEGICADRIRSALTKPN